MFPSDKKDIRSNELAEDANVVNQGWLNRIATSLVRDLSGIYYRISKVQNIMLFEICVRHASGSLEGCDRNSEI